MKHRCGEKPTAIMSILSSRRKTSRKELSASGYDIHETLPDLYPYERYLTAFKASHLLTWTLFLLHVLASFFIVLRTHIVDQQVPWCLYIAVSAECVLTFPDLVVAMTIFFALFVYKGSADKGRKPRPFRRLQGPTGPSIDIMITCCGEPVEVILNTVVAAAKQDYPAMQLRVFVLDDANDEHLRNGVDALNESLETREKELRREAIVYLSRRASAEKEHQTHFKSGNLRFGIQTSEAWKGMEPSEFIAGLDADMIPDVDWLRRTVPYLIVDENVAVVCVPQNYYNVPESDPLGQQSDFDIYFSVQEVLNDSLGAPMCTGTGYVARRSALTEIGGWPLAYSGEDYMCSTLLSGAGWTIAFIREPVQAGLAPTSLESLLNQRMRWTNAGLEVHQRLGPYSPSSPLTSRMISSVRNINRLYYFRDYTPVTTTLAYVLLPIVLFLEEGTSSLLAPSSQIDIDRSVAARDARYVYWAQILFIAAFISRCAHERFMYCHLDLSLIQNIRGQEFWCSPYSAYRCLVNLASMLPKSTKSKDPLHLGAWAGALTTSHINERDPARRASLLTRLSKPNIAFYIIYALCAFGVLVFRLFGPSSSPLTDHSSSPIMGAGFMFPSLLLKLSACAWGISKPVRYMIWPPTAPEWETTVEEDEDGIKRPKREWRSVKKVGRLGAPWALYTMYELGIILWCIL